MEIHLLTSLQKKTGTYAFWRKAAGAQQAPSNKVGGLDTHFAPDDIEDTSLDLAALDSLAQASQNAPAKKKTDEVTDSDCNQGVALLTDVQATLAVFGKGGTRSGLLQAVGGAIFSTFSALAGAHLLASGLGQMRSGDTVKEKLSGLSESSWGGQVLLTHAITQSSALVLAAQALGALGGGIQAGLGLHSLGQGLGLFENEDGEKVRSKGQAFSGLAETATGASWALASLGIATSVTAPAFLALALGGAAYKHRHRLAAMGRDGVNELKNTAKNARYLFSMLTPSGGKDSYANKMDNKMVEARKTTQELLATLQDELKSGKSTTEVFEALKEKRLALNSESLNEN